MDIFEKALSIGLKAGSRLTRTALTLSRTGALATTDLVGTQGKSLFKTQSPGQPVVIVKSVDFLIYVADYEIDGTLTEPKRNDEITKIIGTKKFTYKVLPLGKSIPFFQYSDTGHTLYRVHTKFDKQEAV